MNGGGLKNVEPGFELIKELKPSIVTFYTQHAQLAQLFTQGDVWITSWTTDRSQAMIDNGAPIAWTCDRPRRSGAVLDAVASDLGPPVTLVNNAGIYPDHTILDMPEAAWDAVLETNLKGTFLCSQTFARLRVAAGGGGAIVNLASTAAFSARVGAAHYSASKAGVAMLTKSLAQELGPHGIRANAVAPGLIEVREDQVSAAYRERFLTMIPRGRTGQAPDVAQVVSFLLSDAADYVTGECVVVDGGFLTGRSLLRSSST